MPPDIVYPRVHYIASGVQNISLCCWLLLGPEEPIVLVLVLVLVVVIEL
jgi:hypothetical protein